MEVGQTPTSRVPVETEGAVANLIHAHKAWTVVAHERFLGIRLLQRIIRVAVPVLQPDRKLDVPLTPKASPQLRRSRIHAAEVEGQVRSGSLTTQKSKPAGMAPVPWLRSLDAFDNDRTTNALATEVDV